MVVTVATCILYVGVLAFMFHITGVGKGELCVLKRAS